MTIIQHDLKKRLTAAGTWFVIAFTLISVSWLGLTEVFFSKQASLQRYFDFLLWASMIVLPALSLDLFSDDERSGWAELKRSWPVSEVSWILGRVLSAWSVWLVFLGVSVVLPVFVSRWGDLDGGQVGASYVGLALWGLMVLCLASGVQALSRQSLVGFLAVTLFLLASSWLGDAVFLQTIPEFLQSVVSTLSLSSYTHEFFRGVVSLSAVLMLLGLSLLFLFLTQVILVWRR